MNDPFGDRIRQAIGYARQLQHLLPMAQQGKIQVDVGEDHAQLVLAYVVAKHPVDGGTGQ